MALRSAREDQSIDPLRLCSVGAVRRLLLEHQIRPSKTMGQSFIVNRTALAKIVEAAELTAEDGVLEVGTGFGTLTASLAQRCRVVVSLEKDRRLFSVAQSLLVPLDNVALYWADALTVDWAQLLRNHEVARWKFVSNLPYAISKPLLMRLLYKRHLFADATVTVQREVAQRMVAKPGDEGYSLLSVAVQFYAEPRILFHLPPTSFFPEPEVWSSVVKVRLLPQPRMEVQDERWFFRVAEAVLMHRRKTIVNALHQRFGIPKDRLTATLQSCSIPPDRRGETLWLDELARLADALRI